MWLSKNIRYGLERGYVMLQLPPVALSPFTYENSEYEAKEELHCSLLCIKKLAESFDNPEQAVASLVEFVKVYIQSHRLEFTGFVNKVYVCEDEEAKSIVIGAKVNGVDQLFGSLRSSFKELSDLASPALHVTLYKYNHRFGIGIQNEAELRELCRPIPSGAFPQMKELL